MKRDILQEPDPRLAEVAQVVEGDASASLIHDIVQDLADTMSPTDLGLAAPQIGEPVRVIVAKIPELTAMVNPSWTFAGPKRPTAERCLSVGDGRGGLRSFRMMRHTRIAARWTGIDGVERERELSGLDAVVFQHEVDHLDGITINRKRN